ncbi:MAG: methionyl-tRNA formyltransferase [Candidatus Omnitrophica bacterium]|nr:methionyl-tRNA formyltransferase [Candidatus Omnitrophota bacterium]
MKHPSGAPHKKILYFGSSRFSRIVLEMMCAHGRIPAHVITRPARPRGRGLSSSATETHQVCLQRDIPVEAPETLTGSSLKTRLSRMHPEYLVLADYGGLLPDWLLKMPSRMPLGVHPSLLPKYRGAAPVHWALLRGERETGVTIFRVEPELDAGGIISQRKISVDPEDTVHTLTEKLARAGGTLLSDTLTALTEKKLKPKPQDESKATYAPKLKKSDGNIRWGAQSASQIINLIRATTGWPSAYTFYRGRQIKIIRARAVARDHPAVPGTVLAADPQGIEVGAGAHILKVSVLQPEGKRPMDAGAFLSGYRIQPGDRFSSERNGKN